MILLFFLKKVITLSEPSILYCKAFWLFLQRMSLVKNIANYFSTYQPNIKIVSWSISQLDVNYYAIIKVILLTLHYYNGILFLK